MTASITLISTRRRLRSDGSDSCRLFPKGFRGGRRWLYALGYLDGRTKIGVAMWPRDRMFQHWSASGGIAWAHLFCSFPIQGRRNQLGLIGTIERAALRNAGQVGERIRRSETFRGLSREEAIRCVRQAIAEQGG